MNTNLKEIEIKVDNLILDPNNPRFARHAHELLPIKKAEEVQGETYRKMIAKENNFEVPELAENIRINGFLGFDRLFVKKINGSKYIVVEGNRRLAALQYVLKKNQENPNRYEISKEVSLTFEKIPCIDLTNWEEEDIKRLLGLRHYDSVKDWKPLPGSFNLFVTYMNEYCKLNGSCNLDLNNNDYDHEFVYDRTIAKKIADIYSIKETRVKSLLLTYRVYLQIRDQFDSNGLDFEINSIFSLIEETIAKPVLRDRFEFDQRTGIFSDDGLELFIDLCFGSEDKKPVITEVARGESTIRDYAYVLQKGDDYDRERIEIHREKAEVVKADLKSRENERNLINTLKQIKAELGKVNLDQINLNEITDREKEIIDELQSTLNKLKGASQGKL